MIVRAVDLIHEMGPEQKVAMIKELLTDSPEFTIESINCRLTLRFNDCDRYRIQKDILQWLKARMITEYGFPAQRTSYCSIHDTFPKDDEPCWQCVNEEKLKSFEEGKCAAIEAIRRS